MSQNESVMDYNYLIDKYKNVFSLRNNDFFELLGMDFYLQEFLFFSQEAYFFAKLNAVDINKAKEIGIVSSLVYLSTKIHFFIDSEKNFVANVQFPILLGDLLYGKVIEILSSGSCSEYIDDYLIYLQQLNAKAVDYFANKTAKEDVEQSRYAELAVLTAKLAGADDLSLAYKMGEEFAKGTLYQSPDLFLEKLSAKQAELFREIFVINADFSSIIKSTNDLCRNMEQ